MTGKKFEKQFGQDRDAQERVKEVLGIMLPYQRRFIEDKSAGSVWEASRQIGKSFGLTFKSILETALSSRPIESVYGSASARQVFRSGREMRRHIKALSLLTEGKLAPDKNNAWLIAFPGDRFLNLVPSNPDTIPGFSGHVYLDEFGLHKDDWGIWRAAVPAITRGYGVRVASTHRGTKTKFYSLVKNKSYSHHRTSIHDAIREGLILKDEDGNIRTVESLCDLVADPMVWLEEYELEPQDDATAWLTWELIRAAEDEYADPTPDWVGRLLHQAVKARKAYKNLKSDPPWWAAKSRELTAHLAGIGDPIDLGMDIGRTRDLSVIWLARRSELARFYPGGYPHVPPAVSGAALCAVCAAPPCHAFRRPGLHRSGRHRPPARRGGARDVWVARRGHRFYQHQQRGPGCRPQGCAGGSRLPDPH